MKLINYLSISVLFFYGCSNPVTNMTKEIKTENVKSLIVRFKDNVLVNDINNFNQKSGIKDFKIFSEQLKLEEIKTKNINEFNLLKNKLQTSNLIKYAEGEGDLELFPYDVKNNDKPTFSKKDIGVKPNDPFYSLQWNALAIEADKAWTITTGDVGITIAVIDSGVDPDHPDLKDNVLPMIDILAESGKEDTYQVDNQLIDYSGQDGNGHGTHVTGILGALINNKEGIAGIAGNINILPIKAVDHLGKTSSTLATKAILKAIEKNVDVINLSVGGPKSEGTQALKDAVQMAIDKGILFVSATGNASNRSKNIVSEVTVPAAYPGVISVGALTKADKVADYSDGGPEIEISAPGGSDESSANRIYSTWPTYRTYEGYTEGIKGPYAAISGTSMAAPHVSAVAALLFTKEPNLTAQQVRVRILASTTDVDAKGFDNSTGYGKINAYKTLINDKDGKARE